MPKNEKNFIKVVKQESQLGFVYFLTFIGAAIYWVQQASGFGEFLVAIMKAVVWPAFVMHRILGLLSL